MKKPESCSQSKKFLRSHKGSKKKERVGIGKGILAKAGVPVTLASRLIKGFFNGGAMVLAGEVAKKTQKRRENNATVFNREKKREGEERDGETLENEESYSNKGYAFSLRQKH